MQTARQNPAGDFACFAAFVVLLAFASLGLTQCTMLSDHLTGVTLDRAAPTGCVKQCQHLYANLLRIEEKIHATKLEECLAIDPLLAKDCYAAEAARHSAAREQMSADKTNCLLTCTSPR